jgi:hypothetical protein
MTAPAAATATTTRLVQRAELTSDDLSAMHNLLGAHFAGVTAAQFHDDIAEKNWAILIERAGQLLGFTTILAYERFIDSEPVSVIYSGDTIVSPEGWNSSALPRAWIESAARLRRHYPRGRYLWLLITSGFRTYRFLPVFWREFYPRYDAPTPPRWQQALDQLAAGRFGARYDRATGIVRLNDPQRLRDNLAGIPANRTNDPHVAFFASRNPGHAQGDELVCVTELTPANLTPAGRRMAAAIPQW